MTPPHTAGPEGVVGLTACPNSYRPLAGPDAREQTAVAALGLFLAVPALRGAGVGEGGRRG